MSRIAQPALAAAAIVAVGSALLPAASLAADLEIYQEKNSGPCADQRFHGKIVYWADAVLSDRQTQDIGCRIEGGTGCAGIGGNIGSACPALIAGWFMTVAALSSRETPASSPDS